MACSDRPRVTCLAPFVPFRAIPHAGGRFLYEYLTRASRSADITLVAPGSEVNRQAVGKDTPSVDIHLVPVRRRPRTRAGFAPRLVANSFAGVTPGWQVLRGFRSDPWVWRRIQASDLVELQWAWYLPFVNDIRALVPGMPVMAFEHDVLAVSLRRRAERGLLHERVFGRWAAGRARRLEPALLNRSDIVFTFSDRDRVILRDLAVERPIEVIDPLIAPGEGTRASPEDPMVLFVGAMDRPENHQGAAWLAERVWPLVESAHPHARLVLAGASPPPALTRLARESVAVTGFVDDLAPLYRQASVFVAPNLTGAGVKFKVLDALSHGLPVVATSVAAEGIAQQPTSPGFAAVTDDPTELARAVTAMLSEPSEAARIGDAGRAWVRATYDFDRSVARILSLRDRLIAQAPHR